MIEHRPGFEDLRTSKEGSLRRAAVATTWTPILDGVTAEAARATVADIARVLEPPPKLATPAGRAKGRRVEDASLSQGQPGLAILFGYLAQAGLAKRADEISARCLDQAAATVATTEQPPWLYGGFAGVAWATAHLEGRLSEGGGDDFSEEIDQALLKLLDRSPWRDDYDLVSGLVGHGVYALERLPRASAAEMIERVVDRLDETAERCAAGATWHTPPDLLPARLRKRCPSGHYNLGVAHGVPGVIAFLGGAVAAGVARKTARSLLDEAVRWLLGQKLVEGSASVFPTSAAPELKPEPSRSAWCYGDPGIAAALLCTARSVGEAAWEREAHAIARRAADRPADQAGVRDAGLCHGAAGLGHVFNRLFQATRDERLGEAARFWLVRALEMRRKRGGVAGYTAHRASDSPPDGGLSRGVLEGAAGIALALLAAVSPIEPEWDRMLLLSARASGPRLRGAAS
jgi:class I lanthipeptide synthase